jgi:hypothetical protein
MPTTCPTTCPTTHIDAVIARIKATKQHDAKAVDTDSVRDTLATAPYMQPYQGINGGWKANFSDERTNARFVVFVLPSGGIDFCMEAADRNSERYIRIAKF